MKEMLEDTASKLHEAAASLDRLVEISAALSDAETKLAAVRSAHDEVSKALEDKKSILDESRRSAIEAHDRQMFDKTKVLRELLEGIKSKQLEHDELAVRLQHLRKEHDNILASVDSIRKRLG